MRRFYICRRKKPPVGRPAMKQPVVPPLGCRRLTATIERRPPTARSCDVYSRCRETTAMAQTVGEYLLRRLRDWGVQRVFGYPGDGINGIMAGFERLGDEPRFVQVRHEEMAAFMACAHAKFTGDPGVCLATSGPGAIHLLNGLYDAAMDHQPVVAIVGQAATTAIGGDYQQEVDLQTLFKDVAHNYVTTVMNVASVRHAIDRAFRIALSDRCVTCVIVPKDLQEEPVKEQEPHAHNTIHSSAGWSSPRIVPRDKDLKRAAEVLNAGEKVAMLIGAGAIRAADEVVQVADTLGAGIAKALLGKSALPDDLPGVTGSIGLLGTKPSWDLMSGCDTLLMVGCSFPYSEFLPKEGQARGVQIDRSQATWRRWGRQCHTRWRRNSPIPTGRYSRSPAMARCR